MITAMRLKNFPLSVHIGLLLLFCIGMVGLWLLPILIAGFPYELSGFIPEVRLFAETKLSPTGNGRIVVLLWWLKSFFGWENVLGWNLISSIAFAAALVPWWWSVYKLFDARKAWLSTVILSLMPIFWLEAVRLSGYSFGLFFLFLGFALFIKFRPWNRLAAVAVFGLCFGATLVSRDAFQVFLPWFVIAYAWCERKDLKRMILELAVACLLAYSVFTSPLLLNVIQGEKLTILLPSLERTMPTTGHLYPDDYTYDFDKEAYDELIRERAARSSFLVQQEDANVRKMFGVSTWNFFESITNSFWLFLTSLPSLFLEDTVGGIFLWLFIIPGIGYLYLKNKKLLYLQLGLFLSIEFLLRFILHFHRIHLMDFGWMLALFASLGIVSIGTALTKSWKKVSITTLSTIIVVIIAAQLIQANRKQFARLYTETDDYLAFAASAAVDELPEGSIVAYPRIPQLLYFAEREHLILHDETIDRLREQGRLRDPFKKLGITHIIGYSEERTAAIKNSVYNIKTVTFDEGKGKVEVTPLVRLMLHMIR